VPSAPHGPGAAALHRGSGTGPGAVAEKHPPDLYRALASPIRREILRLLADGDLVAGDVAKQFAMAWSGISRHLRVLGEAGLVVSVRRGGNIVYSLRSSPLDGIASDLIRLSARHSEPGRTGARMRHGLAAKALEAHPRAGHSHESQLSIEFMGGAGRRCPLTPLSSAVHIPPAVC
jgi:DNA-binding transcriptional ArsR family regulator